MLYSVSSFIKYMLKHMRKKREIPILLFLLLIMSSFSLISAALSKNLINNVFIPMDTTYLYTAIVLIIPIYLINSIISILYTYLNAKFYTRFSNSIKLDFFNKLQRAPYGELCQLSANDVYYRLFQDTSIMTGYLYSVMISAPVNLFLACAITVMLFIWSPILTIYIVFFTIIQLCVALLFRKPFRRSFSSLRTNEQSMASDLGTHFQIIDSIKIFGLEDYSHSEFEQKYDKLSKIVKKNSVLTSLYGTIASLLKQFWSLGLIFIGAKLMSVQQITIGTFMGIFMLSGSLYAPLSSIVETCLKFEETNISFNRYLDYYKKYRNEEYSGNKKFMFEHKVDFSNIFFSYDRQNVIIDNFSFTFPKNAIILINGESGVGKTTFAKLISRLLYPTSGKISIDSNDIMDFEYKSLRSGICFMTQNPVLINDTVIKNVFPSGDVDENRFWEIMDAVGLSETIKRLPQKEYTLLGYRGVNFSEGEKQRISLARTLIKRPSILVVDEPTSALDEKNKRLVYQALLDYQVATKCLLFVISHDNVFDNVANYKMDFIRGRVAVRKCNV